MDSLSYLDQLCQAFCPSGHDCTAWLEHSSDQELAGAHVFAWLETSMRGSGNVYAPTSFQHGYRTWPRHTHSPRTKVFYHRPCNFFPAPYSSLLLLLWWMILSVLWSLTPQIPLLLSLSTTYFAVPQTNGLLPAILFSTPTPALQCGAFHAISDRSGLWRPPGTIFSKQAQLQNQSRLLRALFS